MAIPQTYSGNGILVRIEDPENITRDECIALARIGRDSWNQWRDQFPVRRTTVNGKCVLLNTVDFSKHAFRDRESDFSGFKFGEHASFFETEFSGNANFDRAIFGNDVNFSHTHFGKDAGFQLALFLGKAFFVGVKFDGLVSFIASQIDAGASFFGTNFANGASFARARFSSSTTFSGAHFGQYADFSGTIFGGETQFTAARFTKSANFGSSSHLGHGFPAFKGADESGLFGFLRGREVLTFGDIYFDGAVFGSVADFSGRKFEGRTSFSPLGQEFRSECVTVQNNRIQRDAKGSAVIFLTKTSEGSPTTFVGTPLFHNCKLHQDTSFDGAKFPIATGSEDAARAYRTLKLSFAQQQAIREEQRFFELEMKEEAAGLSNLNPRKWLYSLFWFLSGYGFSVWRPYVLLIAANVLFFGFYAHQSPGESCWYLEQGCSNVAPLVQFSLANALPGFERLAEPAALQLFGKTSAGVANLGVWTVITLLTQKSVSLLALFLIGLALRNLFKMK